MERNGWIEILLRKVTRGEKRVCIQE